MFNSSFIQDQRGSMFNSSFIQVAKFVDEIAYYCNHECSLVHAHQSWYKSTYVDHASINFMLARVQCAGRY